MLKDLALVRTESQTISVSTLYENRARYRNYPPFQRELVWYPYMKQLFIDTLLRRFPINALLLMRDLDTNARRMFQIIDGQQRVETIIEFIENGFPTMTEQEAKAGLQSLSPIEPGSTFSHLSRMAQNDLLDADIPLTIFDRKDEDLLEEIYLRTNKYVPHSVGEQLFIRNGKARRIALSLLEHPFWTEKKYTGKTIHKESFQAVLQLLLIEALSFPVNLRLSHQRLNPLNHLVLGEYDDFLSDTFRNTIWKHLSDVIHLFWGARIRSKRDIIPVYEAVLLLEHEGFDLQKSEKGCLADWFVIQKRGSLVDRPLNYHPFARMDHLHIQKDFWEKEASQIVQLPGLVKK